MRLARQPLAIVVLRQMAMELTATRWVKGTMGWEGWLASRRLEITAHEQLGSQPLSAAKRKFSSANTTPGVMQGTMRFDG